MSTRAEEMRETRAESGSSWRWAGLVAAALSVLHFASFDIDEQAIVTDIRYYLYFAWQVTEGVPPHVSSFDPKSQLATFAGALLFTLGEALGVDPLLAIRAGYLAIAALGGWLLFQVHRRLAGGSDVAGFLGLLAYTSFGLLGAFPAVGNIPKLLMAVLTTATALAVHDRRWWTAGALATLAFLDWQIGALTCVAAFASALVFGRPRGAAALRVVAGGALAAAPYVAYFAAKGALRPAFEQTILSALFRGATSMRQQSVSRRVAHILEKTREACPEHMALFYLSLAGIGVALFWLWRWRRDARLRLLLPLVAVHLGVLAFSLLDFQGLGDVNVILHGSAFFLGALWVALWCLGSRFARGRRLADAWTPLALVGAFAAGRPGWLRPELVIGSALTGPGVTLADQRLVAREIESATRGRRLAVLENSELLFLLRYTNPLPTIYANPAAIQSMRTDPDAAEPEPAAAVITRVLREARADAVIYFSVKRPGHFPHPWKRRTFRSPNGQYTVHVDLLDP